MIGALFPVVGFFTVGVLVLGFIRMLEDIA